MRSAASSPFSPLAAPVSPSQSSSISSLIITAGSNASSSSSLTKMCTNVDDEKNASILVNKTSNLSNKQTVWPPVSANKYSNEESSNKYTFKPIQLPPPPLTHSASNGSSMPLSNKAGQQVSRKRSLNPSNSSLFNSTATSFASLAQLNLQNNHVSPMNSPAHCCDSPISYSPSVSIASSSIVGEKPDSGYQSSIQNNSDSESCI